MSFRSEWAVNDEICKRANSLIKCDDLQFKFIWANILKNQIAYEL